MPPKESTFTGVPPHLEGDERKERQQTGPRPSMPVTTGLPQRRGAGQPSSGGAVPQRQREVDTEAPPTPPAPPPNMQQQRPPPPAPSGGRTGTRAPLGAQRPAAQRLFFPPQPRSLMESGLTQTMGEELILKALFFAGEMRGSDISAKIKLPQLIVDEIIEGLRRQKYVDLKGGAGMGVGKSSMIYTLTTFATEILRQILDRNRYNGPAPVRMEDWYEAVQAQTVRGMRIGRARMEKSFGDLVVKDAIYDGLGPALNSGRAVFFYGPPGNGKTALCQSLVRCYDGDIYVPHALLVDDFIIRVFDPILHQQVPEDPNSPAPDQRWVRCKRPLVVVGGELTLETLDLIYSSDVSEA